MKDVQDSLKVTGDLIIIKTTETGETETYNYKNLVVTTGKEHIVSRMTANTAVVMSHMAVGSGNTAAAVSDTALETELARVSLDVAGGTASGNTVTYAATFAAGTGTGAIEEAGVLNDASAGTMLCRTVFPVVNKGANDSISISWVVTLT